MISELALRRDQNGGRWCVSWVRGQIQDVSVSLHPVEVLREPLLMAHSGVEWTNS